MVASTFFAHRQQFFTTINSDTPVTEIINRAEKTAKNYGFLFEANKHDKLANEVGQLYEIIAEKRRHSKNIDKLFIAFCLDCCVLILHYYRDRMFTTDAKREEDESYDRKIVFYKKMQSELIKWYDVLPTKGSEEKETRVDLEEAYPWLQQIQANIAKDMSMVLGSIKHLSSLHVLLSYANIYRILLSFSRIMSRQMLLLGRELKWIRNGDVWVANLNAVTPIFNGLSVGIFGARLILNLARILKHTVLPTAAEKQIKTRARFLSELNKHHAEIVNDVVWATVNSLSNYSELIGIAAPIANWLTAGFLFFDLVWNTYRMYLAWETYKEKEKEYVAAICYYKESYDSDNSILFKKYHALLEEQKRLHYYQWEQIQKEWVMNIIAAMVLLAGFTAALLLASSTVGVTVCYFVCAIAVAGYFSASAFGAWRRWSKEYQDQQKLEGEDSPHLLELKKEVSKNRNAFICALVVNTILPVGMVTLYATFWPAALALTILYFGWQYYQHIKPIPKVAIPGLKLQMPLDEIVPTVELNDEVFDAPKSGVSV